MGIIRQSWKYDAVVKHIRELGLSVQINLVYARIGDRNADMPVQRFRDYAAPALRRALNSPPVINRTIWCPCMSPSPWAPAWVSEPG